MTENQACNNYKWDPKSAVRKATSNIQITVATPTPVVSIGKSFNVTKPTNPSKDAYRNCANCQKHVNYHNKQLPKK
jgi:hypothetical protein